MVVYEFVEYSNREFKTFKRFFDIAEEAQSLFGKSHFIVVSKESKLKKLIEDFTIAKGAMDFRISKSPTFHYSEVNEIVYNPKIVNSPGQINLLNFDVPVELASYYRYYCTYFLDKTTFKNKHWKICNSDVFIDTSSRRTCLN